MEDNTNDKYCYNCYWYNGEQGDEYQFCDDRENYVHENECCYRWRSKE